MIFRFYYVSIFSDHYSFVFDEQRLLTSLSRGEKATFIIGSAELLRENAKWNKILEMALNDQNYVREPPQPAEAVVGGIKRKRIQPPMESDNIHPPKRQKLTHQVLDARTPLAPRQEIHRNRRERQRIHRRFNEAEPEQLRIFIDDHQLFD